MAAGTVVVAMFSIQPFKDSGGALPSANTHRDHSVLNITAFHFPQNCRREFCASAAQRMSKRDRASVRIHLLDIQAGLLNDSQRLHREGLVKLNDADAG